MRINLSGYRRIAIAGAHGCGKTFLAERLAKATGLPLVPEYARHLMESVSLDWKNPSAARHVHLFQKAIYYSHLLAVGCLPRFVSDRTVLDVAAYCEWHVENNPALSDVARGELADMARHAISQRGGYDLILVYSLPRSYAESPDASQTFIHERVWSAARSARYPSYADVGRGDVLAIGDATLTV